MLSYLSGFMIMPCQENGAITVTFTLSPIWCSSIASRIKAASIW
jgi:hypothetical protein